MRIVTVAALFSLMVFLPGRFSMGEAAAADGRDAVEEPGCGNAPPERIDVTTATIRQGDEPAEEAAEEELADMTDEGSEGAPEEFDDERFPAAIKSIVTKAEALYGQAIHSYAGGNSARARRLYSESLRLLSSADIDPRVQYSLSEDFGNLFSKLKRLLSGRETAGGKYSIPLDADNELVQGFVKHFTVGGAREGLRAALERGGRYRGMIVKVLREYDLPEELVYLPLIESHYDNDCRSCAGALGLWQLMPERARCLGLKVNYWIDERKDPEKATRAACRYLKELYQMFDDWHLALAAYNRGEHGLARDLQFSRATNIREISSRNAVPKETEYFVPQFIACALVGENPGQYGLTVRPGEPLEYDRVIVYRVIDLKVVALCCGSTIGEIRRLNPALKAWCTPHNYAGFELHLPPGTRDRFLAALARVKDLNPCQGYIKYQVARGDCLELIARKFKTTVREIRRTNNLRDSRRLRINQTLVIRPGRQYMAAVQE